jgi:hypothetical protein
MGENDLIQIGGLPWIPDGETRQLPTASVASNVLCKRHNEALSPLDHVARRFFEAFDKIAKSFRAVPITNNGRTFLFNGHDIERWMLKTLCGFVASRNAATKSARITGWRPEVKWLKILFGEEPFAPQWGLHFLGSIGEEAKVDRNLSLAPLSNSESVVYGMLLTLTGRRFLLAMVPSPADRTGTLLANSIYHPAGFIMRMGHAQQTITFTWHVPSGGAVTVMYENVPG